MDRKVGIIGYGSMGKMLLWKFAEAGAVSKENLLAANRTREKLDEASAIATICESNAELAAKADIVFVCVRPSDMKGVFEEVIDSIQSDQSDKLLVSLNGNITFDTFDKIGQCRMAKVIPSLTAEINRSQTLVCFNNLADINDKVCLKQLLPCIGEVIELPEHEMGMGSELVSCMPGFIASVFDVLCQAGKKHTEIPEEQVVRMVLNTLSATSDLMLRNGMTFEEVVSRVATKGGITQEGTKVVYEGFPATADLLFEKTLEKRRIIAENARKSFDE